MSGLLFYLPHWKQLLASGSISKPPASLAPPVQTLLSPPYSSAGSQLNEMSEFGQNDSDFDLNIHGIRRESSPISAPVLSLSADNEDVGLDLPNVAEAGAHKAQGPLSVECFLHCNHEDQSGFKWTGPHPLSTSTLADDLFLYISAFFPFDEVYWVEPLLTRLDQSTGKAVGEHLFFLPRVETTMGNLHWMREQMLDIISPAAFEATAPCLQLFLWPSTEPLPYSSHSTFSSLATLPMMPSLDPTFCVKSC
ncbi:hypothetical protein N7508_007291 [Penicillium antarcticum]|uniref:uncharacterized protein n=1 Tax=Penicillium antarcticum TaxID=416450 RepID=UPI0023860353|nr:uncharacterized protein N7508_007291 [Penicillium antarcticum]KAJ5300048.1 hypothetical protein N7508_007291 [Penicillium antarcticum]